MKQFGKTAVLAAVMAFLVGAASPHALAQEALPGSGTDQLLETISQETALIVAQAEEEFDQMQQLEDVNMPDQPIADPADESADEGHAVYFVYEDDADLIEDLSGEDTDGVDGAFFENASDEEASDEDASYQDAFNEDTSNEDTSNEDTSNEDAFNEDAFSQEASSDAPLPEFEEEDPETALQEEEIETEEDLLIIEDFSEHAASALFIDPSGFHYDIVGGNAVITGYTGSDVNVTFPSQLGGKPVTKIGKDAFKANTTLRNIRIPKSVKTIEPEAFAETNLDSVEFEGGSAVEIGESAFFYTGLTQIIFPSDGNIKIGEWAFGLNRQLETLDLDGVVEISPFAFEHCALKDVDTGSKLKKIANSAFWENEDLTTVTLKSVTQIEYAAFAYCGKLENVVFPAKLDRIDYRAFIETKWLRDKGNGPVSTSGVLYYYQGNDAKTLSISSGIRKITTLSCAGLPELKSLTIPSTVDEIGFGAFVGCPKLKEVLIPSSVKKIGDYAFGYDINYSDKDSFWLNYYIKKLYKVKKNASFIIYGTPGSAAQTYAKKNGMEFRDASDFGKKPGVKVNFTGTLPMRAGKTCKAVKAILTLKRDCVDRWVSSNPRIVKVDKKTGKLKALKKGTATIQIFTKLKAKTSFKVKVIGKKSKKVIKTAKVTASSPVTVKKGKTAQLKPKRLPFTSEQKLTFKSSNTKVVTVTKNGKIKGIRKGEAVITIKSGSRTLKIKVTVKK